VLKKGAKGEGERGGKVVSYIPPLIDCRIEKPLLLTKIRLVADVFRFYDSSGGIVVMEAGGPMRREDGEDGDEDDEVGGAAIYIYIMVIMMIRIG
jgi:hypothetical protein